MNLVVLNCLTGNGLNIYYLIKFVTGYFGYKIDIFSKQKEVESLERKDAKKETELLGSIFFLLNSFIESNKIVFEIKP